MNKEGMTLFQLLMFVMILGILALIAFRIHIRAGDFKADLAQFQKEKDEIIERLNQYEQVILNNKYRLLQLEALIQYAQQQAAEQEKSKKAKKESPQTEEEKLKSLEKRAKEYTPKQRESDMIRNGIKGAGMPTLSGEVKNER